MIVLTNSIYANQNPSQKMRPIKFSGIWQCKQITQSQPDLLLISQKKGKLAVPANQWMKKIKSGKIDKYLNSATELKNLWYMTVSVMPIVVGPQRIEKETGWVENQRIETVQSTELGPARIIRSVVETEENLRSLRLY